uniref:AP-4 complex subunit mu-like n=1 Tax=Saccoglossus kowalevskii TaxID=10224 RepID=A0ABM0M129_SACKO|nr:PREDICTED: AP-4 complex subunit mu-like [Saccoglossus kowalevskii]
MLTTICDGNLEVPDFGFPQNTSTDTLKAYIHNDPILIKGERQPGEVASGLFGADHRVAPSSAANKPISASRQLQSTHKNEIFVDVIERLTVLIASNGNVIRSEIDGLMQMKSFLIGSPEIQLGLNEDIHIRAGVSNIGCNNQVTLEDINFHQSVKLNEFDNNKILKVNPPEGEFTVLSYHMSGDFPSSLPFVIYPYIEEIPDKGVVTYVTGVGESAEYKQSEKAVVWKIKKIPGLSDVTAKFKVSVSDWNKKNRMEIGPISMEFEIPNFVLSHLQIRFLKLFDREHSYVPLRWVRYVTHSDSYVVRLI